MKGEREHHQLGCGICGAEDKYLLHNVRHRTSSYRRLCTNCLLKDHRGLFCPFCFTVYEETPNDRSMCTKCPSIAHKTCIPSNYPHQTNFICPSCSSPNFSFLKFPSRNPDSSFPRIIDKDSARAVVAAAKIAAVSMTKAAVFARAEAEKKVKEATVAKKRAREALEKLAYLAAKENENKEDTKVVVRGGGGGSNDPSNGVSPRILKADK